MKTIKIVHDSICLILFLMLLSIKTFSQEYFDPGGNYYIGQSNGTIINFENEFRDTSIYFPETFGTSKTIIVLWESYVYKKLKKLEDIVFKVRAQQKQVFWKPEIGYSKNIKPDIVISIKDEVTAIIDTKWKLPNDMLPSDDDLKQMFAYNKRFLSIESILLYPGENGTRKGTFFDDGFCSVQSISILKEKKLDAEVFGKIKKQFCSVGVDE